LDKVLHRTDHKVDGAVDLGQPGPAVALPANVSEAALKFLRIVVTTLAVAITKGKLHPFVLELMGYPSHLLSRPPL
jgi:hypothetical protein